MRISNGLSQGAAEYIALRRFLEGETNETERRFVGAVLGEVMQNELTPRQRAYFLLYYTGGMTSGQIAAQYGVNRSTVCRALASARSRVAKPLRYVLLALRRAQGG